MNRPLFAGTAHPVTCIPEKPRGGGRRVKGGKKERKRGKRLGHELRASLTALYRKLELCCKHEH